MGENIRLGVTAGTVHVLQLWPAFVTRGRLNGPARHVATRTCYQLPVLPHNRGAFTVRSCPG